ncbi:phosphoglucosamine mutase [Dietzia sp.]|uniref:phosphoglucosamine mutase n=1 Tax=Dietzia sp. TaxID=1871616 RepID=UPI002FDA3021
MARLFGTDGVRGLANKTLRADLALSLGAAAASVLAFDPGADTARGSGAAGGSGAARGENAQGERAHGDRPLAVVGVDPRVSGEMLSSALAAGLASQGVDVLLVGQIPTPAVAFLTAHHDAALGAMISASHNPMPDNGIKFFAAGGRKLSDELEDRIEAALETSITGPTGNRIGRISAVSREESVKPYVEHLLASVPNPLAGIKVVVDCAHGAAFEAAPAAYRGAGAEVVAINADPDGYNINEGVGSTHIEGLQKAVVEHGADIGLAHDGDADRCLAVDASGRVVGGDEIMAILALGLSEAGKLKDDTLVATVMSNLGLRMGLEKHGISIVTTKVGDRYVLEELDRSGRSLGGEQSGHVVLPDFATTGDGTLTGLFLMARMAETKKSLAELAEVMQILPQVLINVPVQDKAKVSVSESVTSAVASEEAALAGAGRVLLRPSGTEQVVRVMVEAETEEIARRSAERLAEVVGAV